MQSSNFLYGITPSENDISAHTSTSALFVSSLSSQFHQIESSYPPQSHFHDISVRFSSSLMNGSLDIYNGTQLFTESLSKIYFFPRIFTLKTINCDSLFEEKIDFQTAASRALSYADKYFQKIDELNTLEAKESELL